MHCTVLVVDATVSVSCAAHGAIERYEFIALVSVKAPRRQKKVHPDNLRLTMASRFQTWQLLY